MDDHSPLTTHHSLLTTHHSPLTTFEVIDTGVGIPPEDQAKILEPFQRGKAGATTEGTGLGLTIAQKQIELMGGQLAFESPPLTPCPLSTSSWRGGRG